MSSSTRSLTARVVKAVSAFFMFLPMGVSLWVARMAGYIGYWLLPKKRAVAYANLRTIFAGEKTPQELHRIIRQVFVNFAQNFMEMLCMPKIMRLGVDRLVDVKGMENVQDGFQQGKGLIFLALHSGNWELASVVGSLGGYPYNIVANILSKDPALDAVLNEYRGVGGAKVIAPGVATREIIKALKNNEAITLVLDQGGKDGVAVNFFGKTASMSTGAVRLAIKYGCAICLAWIRRGEDGRHTLEFFTDLHMTSTGDLEKDVRDNVQRSVDYVEKFIKEHPQEYLWFYKVYKYTTTPQIVVLNDGRVGHLRQAQAVSRSLMQVLKDNDKQAREKIVDIVFRDEGAAKLFSLYAFLAQYLPFLQGEACLKHFLNAQSYADVLSVKADYLVSAGSRAAGVSFILKKNHMAKAVQVLTPGILNAGLFDLNVLPEHDKIPAGAKKLLRTKVALSLISPAYLKANSDGLLRRYSHLKGNVRTKFALFIGGNTKGIVFDEAKIRLLINHLKEAAVYYNAEILVTTSRRTPPSIEQIISKELKSFERCPLCIIANQGNVPEAVGGILGLADLVIVSGESVSMVSEAVASGKKTIVFDPRGSYAGTARDKYEQFVLNLSQQGYVMATSVKDLPGKISQLMSHKIYLKAVDDTVRLSKALEEII